MSGRYERGRVCAVGGMRLGSGMLELALRYRGDAYRVVYAVRIDAKIWVVHAFQKKSKAGIATPKPDIDVIVERLKRLREALR